MPEQITLEPRPSRGTFVLISDRSCAHLSPFPPDDGKITGKQSVREQLNVEFHNSFTGQTGAGKSLVQEFNTGRN